MATLPTGLPFYQPNHGLLLSLACRLGQWATVVANMQGLGFQHSQLGQARRGFEYRVRTLAKEL